MSTYDDGVRALRMDLPERWRKWVDKSHPCRCDEAWTGRGMHDLNCQWAVAIDVLWEALQDGMITDSSGSKE